MNPPNSNKILEFIFGELKNLLPSFLQLWHFWLANPKLMEKNTFVSEFKDTGIYSRWAHAYYSVPNQSKNNGMILYQAKSLEDWWASSAFFFLYLRNLLWIKISEDLMTDWISCMSIWTEIHFKSESVLSIFLTPGFTAMVSRPATSEKFCLFCPNFHSNDKKIHQVATYFGW